MQELNEPPIRQHLRNLQKSDERFQAWRYWMIPGAKFRISGGDLYQIKQITAWGWFDCQELGKAATMASFSCQLVAMQTPVKPIGID